METPRQYIRLDHCFILDNKYQAMVESPGGPLAILVHIGLIAASNRNNSDGLVTDRDAKTLAKNLGLTEMEELIALLIEHRLLTTEEQPGTYRIPNYGKWQLTKAVRELKVEAGRAGGKVTQAKIKETQPSTEQLPCSSLSDESFSQQDGFDELLTLWTKISKVSNREWAYRAYQGKVKSLVDHQNVMRGFAGLIEARKSWSEEYLKKGQNLEKWLKEEKFQEHIDLVPAEFVTNDGQPLPANSVLVALDEVL